MWKGIKVVGVLLPLVNWWKLQRIVCICFVFLEFCINAGRSMLFFSNEPRFKIITLKMLWLFIKSNNQRSFKKTLLLLFPLDFSYSSDCGSKARCMGLYKWQQGEKVIGSSKLWRKWAEIARTKDAKNGTTWKSAIYKC